MRPINLVKRIPWRWRHIKCQCWERFLDFDRNRLEGYKYLCGECHKPFFVDIIICNKCGKEFPWAAFPDTHRPGNLIPRTCFHCQAVRTFRHLHEPRTAPKLEELVMPTFNMEGLL